MIDLDDKIKLEELEILEETYRGAVPQLKFDSVFELLIAVILSAQCTDKRVNEVTQILFPIASTPEKILQLGQSKLEEIIKPCGYFRAKAKHILETAQILIDGYGGEVPGDFDDGEISYRVSIYCGDDDFAPPTYEQIDFAVIIGLMMIEKYGNSLVKVMFGVLEPEDAINIAEADD